MKYLSKGSLCKNLEEGMKFFALPLQGMRATVKYHSLKDDRQKSFSATC